MDTVQNTQNTVDSPVSPISVFKTKFGQQISPGQNWAGKDSLEVVSATIAAIKKSDGSNIELTADQQAIITAVFNPTVPIQMAVVNKVITNAGGEVFVQLL